MRTIKTILVSCLISIASMAIAQIDTDPDGIGIYFDEGATQIVATVAVGESVDAYLIATNPSHPGALSLWEAGVVPRGPAIVVGGPVGGFDMSTHMPGNPSYAFAVAMNSPYPTLQAITILATLGISVYDEGSIGLHVYGGTFDLPNYRVDDFYGTDHFLHPSSGSSDLPVAMINGPRPVSSEQTSWGGVKSLFR